MSSSSSNLKLSIVWKVQLLLYARPSIHSLFNLHAYARKKNYATVVESVFVWKWTLVYRLHLLGENGNRPKTHLFKNALQNGDFENALVLYSCGYQLLDTSKWARSHAHIKDGTILTIFSYFCVFMERASFVEELCLTNARATLTDYMSTRSSLWLL